MGYYVFVLLFVLLALAVAFGYDGDGGLRQVIVDIGREVVLIGRDIMGDR